MAREDKRVELRPVDDTTPETEETIIRLGKGDEHTTKVVRVPVPIQPETSHRLDLPDRESHEGPSQEPGMEALLDVYDANRDLLEHGWAAKAEEHKHIPWGWFVLIGVVIVGTLGWSLTHMRKGQAKVQEVQATTENLIKEEAKEEEAANRLLEDMDKVSAQFLEATSIDELLKVSRFPDRVRPLMEKYYSDKGVTPSEVERPRMLRPLTLDRYANFWMKSLEIKGGEMKNLILEVDDEGVPKVDWETFVCYQPMGWEEYAETRPQGSSMVFRVYTEKDDFFSHEFADEETWNCYRLTTRESQEPLYGYAKKGSEIAAEIDFYVSRNGGKPAALILKLSLAEGLKSRRGMEIEKVMAPRWIYVTAPAGEP